MASNSRFINRNRAAAHLSSASMNSLALSLGTGVTLYSHYGSPDDFRDLRDQRITEHC
jgi:hypothetical protein